MGMFRNLMIASGTRRRDPLYGIHYVADWDGKERSNEEDEPMRSRWIDKATGKVINLNNFAFAGMSGWNGYTIDYTSWRYVQTRGTADIHHNKFTITEVSNNANIVELLNYSNGAYKIKVSGLSNIVKENPSVEMWYGEGGKVLVLNEDGIYDVPQYSVSENGWFGCAIRNFGTGDNPKKCNITVEQLPLYPGALISDGVDDYGVTQEAINEEVGTMLAMLKVDSNIKLGSYFFNCGKNENVNRLYCWLPSDGIPKMGLPSRDITLPMGVLTRTPASPSEVMYIASYNGGSPSKIALYRLILIREQLDETQIAYLVNKVQKEYNDWCKANGYDYAIING